ncbi:heme ABC transporter permease [Flavobacteriaceae bacterium]|nr:heme ABC transporter permease [Flavobacteriaceae bacterium]
MQWLTKIINIKNFNILYKFLIPLLSISLALLIFFGLKSALINSPIDYQQGEAVRIMYIHVPAAWMALSTYFLLFIFNVSFFIWKNSLFFVISKSIAPIGAIFTLVALITGSLWGKPIWGAWWVWDARLTSMLILFFLYLGYIMLIKSFSNSEKGHKIAAIVAIVGFVNIPIIKFSVDFWNTLHQPASIIKTGGIAIDPAMQTPLILMFGCYFNYFILMSFLNIKKELLVKKLR